MNVLSCLIGCSVCFGNPNSPLTKGTIAGVLLLLGVVLVVLTGIAATGIVWARRASKGVS